METTTISPALAASMAVAALAPGPSSLTSAAKVSGPRELPITTGYPHEIASLATWLPMCPAPINPMVGFAIRHPSQARLVHYHPFPGIFHPVSARPAFLGNAVGPQPLTV